MPAGRTRYAGVAEQVRARRDEGAAMNAVERYVMILAVLLVAIGIGSILLTVETR